MTSLSTASLAALASILLSAVPAKGQGNASFGPEIPINVRIDRPQDATSADFDLDGDLDLIFTDSVNDALVLIENLGNGNFEAGRQLDIDVATPSGIAALDLDGDGDDDLLVTDIGTSGPQLRILLNDGLDGFSSGAAFPLPGPASNPHDPALHFVELVDVDGDGDLDARIQDFLTDPMGPSYVAFQRGLFDFAIVQPNPNPTLEGATALADMDGDGLADFITTHQSGVRVYFPYIGNETFGPAVNIDGNGPSGRLQALTVHDLDGDGDNDLLFRREYPAVLFLVENLGAGTFGPFVLLPSVVSGRLAPHPLDLDGDGDLDLVVNGAASGVISSLENLGGLQFASSYETLVGGIGGFALAWTLLKPVTSPAVPDLIYGAFNGGGIVKGQTPGGGQLALSSELFPLSDPFLEASGVAAVDWDGDGDLDVMSTSFSRNIGPGRISRPKRLENGASGLKHLVVADIDGDGDEDLLSRNRLGSVFWVRNDQNGLGQAFQLADFSTNADDAETLIDIDQDGDLDVVAVGTDNTLAYIEQLSPGVFGSPIQFYSNPTVILGIQGADLDADGLLDIVMFDAIGFGPNQTGSVTWLRNLGGASFGPELTAANSTGPINSLQIADLDGSPTPELLWLDRFSRELVIARGLSNGDFDAPTAVQPLLGAGRRLVIDRGLDGTGRDLYVASILPLQDLIGVLRWQGDLQFSLFEEIHSEVDGVEQLALADLDADGDRDLISISEHDQKLVWFANQAVAEVGVGFCDAVQNSTGRRGRLFAVGSTVVASNDLRLTAADLPSSATSLFIASTTTGNVAMPGISAGTLCLGGDIGRFLSPGQAGPASADGRRDLGVNLNLVPQPLGLVVVQAGQTWSFQCWHRDVRAGVPTSNFTSAISIVFS